jgi:hypothetical protein
MTADLDLLEVKIRDVKEGATDSAHHQVGGAAAADSERGSV